MKRNILCIISIMILSLVLMSGSVFAGSDSSDPESAGGVTWSLDGGTLTISGEGAMEDYATASDRPWYKGRESVTKVVVGSGVSHIGDRAFYDCAGLIDVEIGSSVTSIGDWAFFGDTSLSEVTIPASVSRLGDSSFKGCSSLKAVYFEGDAPDLGVEVFKNTGSGLKLYYDCVFTGWDQSPWESYSVEPLHDFTEERITSEPSCTKPGTKSSYCKNCETWIDEEVPALGHDYVDGFCSRCGDEEILGSGSYWTLHGSGVLELTDLPDFKNYNSAPWYENRERVKKVVFKASVTRIGDHAFHGCSNLSDFTIPEGVTSIGTYALCGCKSLTELTIPESVKSVDDYAFHGCRGIKSLTVPDSIKNVSTYGFSGMSGLEEVKLPFSVKLSSSYELKKATILGGTEIVDGAFSGCYQLTDVIIPDSVTKIGEYAFHGCNGLTEFTVPANVTHIGRNAFGFCANLESITIPKTVTSIGPYAFIDSNESLVVDAPRDSEAYIYALRYGVIVKDKVNLSSCTYTNIGTKVYTGSEIKQKPSICYSYKKNGEAYLVPLSSGRDCTVVYKNNKAVGTATMVIKGKRSTTGTVKKTFKIIPKGSAIVKPVAGKKSFTAKWKRQFAKMPKKQITGYQVQYTRDGKFKKGIKTVKVKGVKKRSVKIKRLASKKKYYVRVRTYMKTGGKTYYSKWSSVYDVKTK